MKISIGITIGVVVIVALAVILSGNYSSDEIHQNKIRVAFFLNIGHAVPIVGLENGMLENGILGKKNI